MTDAPAPDAAGPDTTALDDLDASDTSGQGRPDSADAAVEAAREAAGPDDAAETQGPTDAQGRGNQG